MTIRFWKAAGGLRMDIEKIVGDTRTFTGWDTSGYARIRQDTPSW